MLYVGLDIHSKHISICVLDENGKLDSRWRVRAVDQMLEVLGKLPGRFAVCYEVSCGYGHFHDVLTPLAVRVVAAHPGRLKLIFQSKQKNDRRDAERLAKLLFLGEVPIVYVPAAEVREWRQLITYRRGLIGKRTRVKNALRALLRGVGIVVPRRPGLWSKQGLAWLAEQAFVSSTTALQRDLLLDELQTLSAQIRRVERELNRIAEQHPAVWQLRSIPGVGPRTAEAMVAFLDDPHRFRSSRVIGAYFGLVPTQDQSGQTNRLGHITKQGSATVRQLLVEAAWQAIRRSPSVRAYYERIRRNDPDRNKIAVVATAHYLARVMYAMLKTGTLWRESAAASLPRDPQADRQARLPVSAAPSPGQTRRSHRASA